MIKRLYVHNFRCLENFELPISDKQSSLFLGGNGTGKSTVGLVIEVLQRIARGTNRVGQVLRPADLSYGRADVPLRFEIEVTLEDAVYEYTLALELPGGFKELRVLEERLSVDGRAIYTRERAQVTLGKTGRDKEARFLVDWHLVALPIIQEHSEGDPLHILRNWLSRMLVLSPIPAQISGDSQDETLTPNRAVSDFGAWFSGLISQFPAAYTPIDQYLRQVMPDFSDIQNPAIGKDSRSLSVRFQKDRAQLNLPFEALSDGEKCLFICAVLLASKAVDNSLFCFWDEPESHLSLSEVGHFVMTLRRSFQTGGQLVVTSHNPETIRHFSDENTFVFQRHSHLEPTVIRPLSAIHLKGDLIHALILDDLDLKG